MDFNAAAVSLSRTTISTSPPVSLLIQVLMSHTDLQLDHSTRLGNDDTEPERRTQRHRVRIEVVIVAGGDIDIPVRRENAQLIQHHHIRRSQFGRHRHGCGKQQLFCGFCTCPHEAFVRCALFLELGHFRP